MAKKYDDAFPKLKLFTIDEVFGGWAKAQKITSLMAVRSTKLANAKPFINPVTYYVTGFFLCHNFALLFPVYGSQGTHIMKKQATFYWR